MPRSTRRRGSESVEAAVTLPVILLVVFAGIEYGWAALKLVQLDHAAREGAREASMFGASSGSIEARVQGNLASLGIPDATVTMDPQDPSAAAAGTPITVEVQVSYDSVRLLGLSQLMPLPSSLKGRVTMVKEPDA